MTDIFVHPLAVVEEGAQIGEGSKIWHFAHIRGTAKLGTSCNLGKGAYIDADVEIGDNVKIQNGVSVYKGVKIQDDVFCGPHMTFTNDMYPRAFSDSWEICETLVKEGASIGAHAVIICNIVLGEYCMVGAGSVVTKDVPAHGLVMGNPARLVGFVCICGQPLHDEIEKNEDEVIFRCSECNQETVIPASDYNMKVR